MSEEKIEIRDSREMGDSKPFFILAIFLATFVCLIEAQNPTFSCSSESVDSCSTYVTYRASSPDFINLQNISDLFMVTPTSVAIASNLASEEAKLVPGQVLFIPITCACTGNRSFANITYKIKKGDSFFLLSRTSFQNLTDFLAVENMNPSLNPITLQVGVEVVIPIYCKCKEKTHSGHGHNFLITYVLQPGDDVSALASEFKTSQDDIRSENNNTDFKKASGSPVLIPVSELPDLPQPHIMMPRKKISLVWIVLISIVGFLSLVVLGSFLVYTRYSSTRTIGKTLGRSDSSLEASGLIPMRNKLEHEKLGPTMVQDKLLPGLSSYLGNMIVYDRAQIMEATCNLSDRFRIGGSVYKAMINNELVAVKKAHEDSTEEIKILQKLSHANLVKLMGASNDLNGNRLLVYEFAVNGSLDQCLSSKPSFSPSSKEVHFLTWHQRLQIALDVAHGLQYLHEHSQPSIVHADIRTSNILLGLGYKAKISNFSSARSAMSSVTPKVDVFGFGVVLLELLSGRKGMETTESGEIVMLSKEIRSILEGNEHREEHLRHWMDPKLEGLYPIDCAMSLAGLARVCTMDKSLARPSMNEVVFNLSILAHSPSSSEIFERSWASGEDGEAGTKTVRPVIGR